VAQLIIFKRNPFQGYSTESLHCIEIVQEPVQKQGSGEALEAIERSVVSTGSGGKAEGFDFNGLRVRKESRARSSGIGKVQSGCNVATDTGYQSRNRTPLRVGTPAARGIRPSVLGGLDSVEVGNGVAAAFGQASGPGEVVGRNSTRWPRREPGRESPIRERVSNCAPYLPETPKPRHN
jgi:hypothetical protein